MKLSRFIARRYLFAKKSLGVINIISIISAAGIAVGCAALVIILSIYNGFDSIVRELNDSYTADILITPAKGKVFSYDSRFDFLGRDPRVKAACGVLEESVFIQYGERNKVVVARGVDSLFEQTTRLRDHVTEGDFALTYGDLNQVPARPSSNPSPPGSRAAPGRWTSSTHSPRCGRNVSTWLES